MNLKIICVKWREGEDFVEVDLENIRTLTKEELLKRDEENKGGVGVNPFIDNYNWLDCIFIDGMDNYDGYCIKIIQHLGGWE